MSDPSDDAKCRNCGQPTVLAYCSWVCRETDKLVASEIQQFAPPTPPIDWRQLPIPSVIDAAHLERQRAWSRETFGPAKRTHGVLDHIRKELAEIEADPDDLGEWVDVIILAFDGAWRHGWEPQQIIDAIKAKQVKNEARTWPDWRTMSEDVAIEHDRSEDIDLGWEERP